MNRRNFFQTGLVASGALVSLSLPASALASGPTKPQRDPFGGLKIGMTTYTFHKFDLDKAIEFTKEAGVKYISLKDVHLPLKSSREQREAAKRKVEEAGLTLMGGGVIYFKNNEAEIRNVFDYAREAGMPTITCSPDPDALDFTEKLAKEYNIRIAIHNHGPGDQKYPSPLDVLKLVKGRDKLMGICMDVGHTVRLGLDPIAAIHECKERLYDFHMKDITAPTPKATPVPVGRGIIDIVGVLQSLRAMKFPYHVALEYEAKVTDPMPGVVESYAYMRGVLATL